MPLLTIITVAVKIVNKMLFCRRQKCNLNLRKNAHQRITYGEFGREVILTSKGKNGPIKAVMGLSLFNDFSIFDRSESANRKKFERTDLVSSPAIGAHPARRESLNFFSDCRPQIDQK